MNLFQKSVRTFVIALLVVAAGIFPATAQDEDVFIPSHQPFAIVDSITDGAKIQVLQNWLSDVPYDYDCVAEVRPGEPIYGCYRTFLNNPATVKRVYKIGKYNLKEKFNSGLGEGNSGFSWGFVIPNETAKNGDTPTFSCTFTVEGGNKITKNMTFRVRRDGIFNSNRAYMEPMDPETKAIIIERIKDAQGYMKNCDLEYNAELVQYSESNGQFMQDLNIWRPSVVLIHSHGNAVDGGRIYLRDDSYINATNLASSDFTAPAGLFYAAVCEGAVADTLGNAFVNAGYEAYIGYTVSVYTTRNANFYRYFFKKAKNLDRSVATALSQTVAWAASKGWTDVATARIIGDGSNLYLGGTSADSLAQAGEAPMEFKPMSTVIAPWRDISTMVLTEAESRAVETANQRIAVEELMAVSGADLVTGLEEFTNVYRVGYKRGDRFVYGVDVDKETGAVVYEGPLD